MTGLEIVTLGCRLNTAESEAMRALAKGQDDLIIVNSCAVTAEAVRQARKEIRRAAKRRPDARIVVTGCAAQIEPATFAAMPEVAAVIGNREKREAGAFRARLAPALHAPFVPNTPFVLSEVEGRAARAALGARTSTSLSANGGVGIDHAADASPAGLAFPPPFVPSELPSAAPGALDPGVRRDDGERDARPPLVHVSDIMAAHKPATHLFAGSGDRVRAFVEVQNGCDHRCTFCIIPYGRGPSRSVPAGPLIDHIKALVDEGYHEVVLTGVDTTSYGPDLPGEQTLGHLVERVLKLVPDLKRLRLSSLDSVEIDARLFELVTQDQRLQPHLHLSLQAGDDMILKRMKRRHSRAQAVETVQRLKAARPEIAIGADLIAGFPTETDAMADNTLRLLHDCDIVFGHIFPFSPREGTPAAKMPQLDEALIRARARRLREAAEARQARWLATLIGTTQSVLIERADGRGHAGNYAPARLAPGATSGIARGDLVQMHITHIEDGLLVGETL
jgi:threonylcarbamoyladenosine tRNA methylthiotransferase MtaB